MDFIETKYFSYCKQSGIVGPAPKQVPRPTNQQNNSMKNNTLQISLSAIATSGLVMMSLTTLAVTVSYLAVAIIVAVAVVDYRQTPKSYDLR
jgi:hypothetical protein